MCHVINNFVHTVGNGDLLYLTCFDIDMLKLFLGIFCANKDADNDMRLYLWCVGVKFDFGKTVFSLLLSFMEIFKYWLFYNFDHVSYLAS